MRVNHTDLDATSPVGWKELLFGVAPPISQTAAPLIVYQPGYDYQVVGVRSYARGVTAAVTARVYNARANDVLGAVGLAIDVTPEEFQVGAFTARVGGQVVVKAAEADLTFSAAHVVTQNLWGAILVQMDAAGAVTTKVNAATQTTPIGHSTEAAAVEALPAPDAGTVPIGYIALQAGAGGNWTANTDDLVAASDVQDVTFFSEVADADLLGADLAFTALTEEQPDLVTALVTLRGSAADAIVVAADTDGTGALVDGRVIVTIRPIPMGGEVLPVPAQLS